MSEGGLGAPVRHPIGWREPDFYDPEKLDAELRRVFDICHGCRRCFNLCDSFPRLFDLVDAAETGELDGVDSKDFAAVADACTLCDMCFMTKCPYVPPHEFALDFPHLMLRYRAAEMRAGRGPRLMDREIAKTDRNGRLGCRLAPLANWATDTRNGLTRPLMEAVAGIDRGAALPAFRAPPLVRRHEAPTVNREAPAYGRKAVLYATCYGNYNSPEIGLATRAILAHNGVETEIVHPRCCGQPQLEQGDIARVAEHARVVAEALGIWIERGYDVIALVPSCALMLKFEWPLILPGKDPIEALSAATRDVSEYIVEIARNEGLAEGLGPLDGSVTLHIACHARAQNMGRKAAEMLRLVPDIDIQVIERCSGHGGAWGVKKAHFETAIKVGRPVARQAAKAGGTYLASECPLAGVHIRQTMARLDGSGDPAPATHPVALFAKAYGLAF